MIVGLSFCSCTQKLASSRHEGIEKIEDGRAWAYFDIPANYSEKYVNRCVDDVTVSDTIVS